MKINRLRANSTTEAGQQPDFDLTTAASGTVGQERGTCPTPVVSMAAGTDHFRTVLSSFCQPVCDVVRQVAWKPLRGFNSRATLC